MDWYNLVKAIILGVVEGITEWLPISSTGHLILVQEFMNLDARPEFIEMFNVVIQLGAILAVIILYFNKLNPFSNKKTTIEKKDTWSLWFKVIIGCLPAAILGLLFDDWFDKYFHHFLPIAIMLILYGVLFIVIENYNKTREPKITSFSTFTYQTAFLIGVFQILALMPGTSRSGATILGALLLGTSRFIATEFSFFLSIPIMIGASGYKFLKFLKIGGSFTGDELSFLLVGSFVAFIVSFFAIKFLLNFIKTNDFKPFGWYRIILGVILIGYWFLNLA